MENKKGRLGRFERSVKSIYFAFILLFLIIITGVLGFIFIEKYTFFEAFYMTIITVSTVGYGEIRPLSPAGRLFTSGLIIFSFGIFAYVISTITRFIFDGEFRLLYKKYKMNKQIQQLKNHNIICGYGRNGRQAAHELIVHHEAVLIIEKDETIAGDIAEQLPEAVVVVGNATDEEVLQRANINKAKSLITTFPSDADNLFVVLTAREMNSKMTIISRASDDNSDTKLKRAGATNVIMPDKVGGTRMAKLVVEPDIVEFIESILLRHEDEVNLEEISCNELKKCFVNKTIGELNIRSVSGANLIGLKTKEGSYIFNPSPEIQLLSEDKLFALGTKKQIMRLKNILIQSTEKF